MIAAIALGLGAALLYAFAAVLQQRAARRVVGENLDDDIAALRRPTALARFARGLARSRMWLAGWVTNGFGFGLQATALQAGSVAVVQPLVSTQLLFVVAVASVRDRRWPNRRDWASALAVCGGLVAVVVTVGLSPLTDTPHRDRVLVAAACATVLVGAVLLLGRRRRAALASLLLGVAAGLCHAFTAVFLKLSGGVLSSSGLAATLTDWPVYLLLASTSAGLLLVQVAFAAGALPSSVAAFTVTNPVTSIVLGIVAFDAPAPLGLPTLAVSTLGGVVLALGIVGLATTEEARSFYGGRRRAPAAA
ncbi:DMT family transporter [Mycobacterium sp. MYCO198283]|uniref:DMT family transporter n=1 Tax=Mycobacterium sp. MYCO198283 TaxID=2883505 RepID=UPI001E3468DB|nr:DMT family transporter [Mycobacterium sp. MYCO198283]MCG5431855.1 DMT family transporter [Mycobacterium sp. MYCO198283]